MLITAVRFRATDTPPKADTAADIPILKKQLDGARRVVTNSAGRVYPPEQVQKATTLATELTLRLKSLGVQNP